MNIEVNEVYRLQEETDIASFVMVSEIKGNTIIGSPLSGGWQLNIPVADFNEKFVHVPQEELALLKGNFTEKHFDMDDWDETIPGWSNGTRWNGWGCPYFERDVLEKAIENGFISADYTKLIIRDEGAYTIMTMSDHLPKDYDWDQIIDRIRNGEEIYNEEIAPGVIVEGLLYAKEIITVEGRNIETYPLGNGYWTWNQNDEPQVYNQPKP
jgi:hypothetical protein